MVLINEYQKIQKNDMWVDSTNKCNFFLCKFTALIFRFFES